MNTKNITKLIVAVVLTLSVTLGSGMVTEAIGLNIVPSAYASCASSGGGGC